MQKSYYRQISLAPLGPEAIRELLVDLLGADPSTSGLAAVIHARTAGNPFYAEEVVQTLIESGNLQGARGAYRLVTPIERLDVPRSVQALLAARIDRLSESEKQVLQTASVIGKEFSETILREVFSATRGSRAAESEIAPALATLRAREFIHETALYPVTEYAFKHPLTQEVALGSQLVETRKRSHAAVARAIEAAYPDKLDEQAARLAHHLTEAGETLLAAEWHSRAGRFIGASDSVEASRHWQRAIDLLATTPNDPRAAELGARACFHLLALSFRIGASDEVVQRVFDHGRRWAELSGDALGIGRMHQAMSVREVEKNRLESALAHAGAWAEAARVAADPGIRSTANWAMLRPLELRGELAELRRIAQAQLEMTRDHPDTGMREWGMSALTWAHLHMATAERYDGSLTRAREFIVRALELARKAGEPESEIFVCSELASIGFALGDPELSGTGVQRCIELAERLSELSRVSAQSQLGTHLLLTGNAGAALEVLDRAYAHESGGTRFSRDRVVSVFVAALLAAGELERAEAVAEDSLEVCLASGSRLHAIESALALAGVLRARSGIAASARIEALAKLADDMIAETGARNLSPLVALERAELCGLRADDAGRVLHLRAARADFARMEASSVVRELDRVLGSDT